MISVSFSLFIARVSVQNADSSVLSVLTVRQRDTQGPGWKERLAESWMSRRHCNRTGRHFPKAPAGLDQDWEPEHQDWRSCCAECCRVQFPAQCKPPTASWRNSGRSTDHRVTRRVRTKAFPYTEIQSSDLICLFVPGIYSVELVSDSLYEWHVKLRT